MESVARSAHGLHRVARERDPAAPRRGPRTGSLLGTSTASLQPEEPATPQLEPKPQPEPEPEPEDDEPETEEDEAAALEARREIEVLARGLTGGRGLGVGRSG